MNCFLVADSGSTKTAWALVDIGRGELVRFTTLGLNPFFQGEDEMALVFRRVVEEVESFIEDGNSLAAVYFYGAGCTPEKSSFMKQCIRIGLDRFSPSRIEVSSDLLAAARALCGEEQGIACILGTGSNSCYYDGREIVSNVSPLGYVLGDEGSGAVLGKLFVGDLLKKQLPDSLRVQFLERYSLTPGEIIERVYRQPFPNRFLAGFSPFLHENLALPSVRLLVKSAFEAFFRKNVMQYGEYCKKYEVHFTGSVAYFYQELLCEVANSLELRLGRIDLSPLDGLIRFHNRSL